MYLKKNYQPQPLKMSGFNPDPAKHKTSKSFFEEKEKLQISDVSNPLYLQCLIFYY